MTPPPFLPVSRSCGIHSRLLPLKGKPSKKDEFVLTIPAHSIMDKQLFFFLLPFSRGKKIFHSSRIQRKLLQFGHVQHKSHSEGFFAAIVGIGAAAGEKDKRKKERDSPGEGGKTFLPLELLKPTSSLYTLQKYPREHNQPIRGKRDCDLVQPLGVTEASISDRREILQL